MFPNVPRARYATPVSRTTRILRGNLHTPISRIFYPAVTPKIISHTGLEIQRTRESRRLPLHFAEPAFIKLIVMDHSLGPTRDTSPLPSRRKRGKIHNEPEYLDVCRSFG